MSYTFTYNHLQKLAENLGNPQKQKWVHFLYSSIIKGDYEKIETELLREIEIHGGGKILIGSLQDFIQDDIDSISDKLVSCKCKKQHSFKRTLLDLVTGEWCPICSMPTPRFAAEATCREILEGATKKSWKKQTPPWLRSMGVEGELDGLCQGLAAAFEYNGEYHYKIDGKWSLTEEKVRQTKEKDQWKANLCEENNIKLLVIPYWESNNLEEFIFSWLKEHGMISNRRDFDYSILETHKNNLRVRKLNREMENLWGISCLKGFPQNSSSVLTWHCSEGHIWKENMANVKRRGCPNCVGKRPKEQVISPNSEIYLDQCKRFAKQNGGECLSTNFIDSRTPMHWMCKNKHKFLMNTRDMSARAKSKPPKAFCQECVNTGLESHPDPNLPRSFVSSINSFLDRNFH